MADVFVSYKKEDRKHAERVVAALEREGFSVWWDDDLTPRENWDQAIEREAEAAKALVVLWTPRSTGSEWVRAQATLGKARGKLIPFTMEPCELPLAFSMVQSADLVRWRGHADDEAWRKAVGWVAAQCQKPAPTPSKETARKASRLGLWIALGALAVGLSGAGVTAWQMGMYGPAKPASLATPGAPPGGAPPASQLAATPTPSALPPLPPGPLGEAMQARRDFQAAESAPECEAEGTATFEAGQTEADDTVTTQLSNASMAKLDGCEISAVLVEGHADASERANGFEIGQKRADDVARYLEDGIPPDVVMTASFGAEELLVKTEEGISLKKNRRVVVRYRGLPREKVLDLAYRSLGLGDARDRSQPFARIMFGYDRYTLDGNDKDAQGVLENWKEIMAENPKIRILVTGNVGRGYTREYAMALGARQANAVADRLTMMGVQRSRIDTLSVGKERPVMQGDSLAARAANRSVSIELQK